MAKKSLGDMAKTEANSLTNFTDEHRNKQKRLTFNVSGADHTQFQKDAADAGLTLTQYFMRLWKGK